MQCRYGVWTPLLIPNANPILTLNRHSIHHQPLRARGTIGSVWTPKFYSLEMTRVGSQGSGPHQAPRESSWLGPNYASEINRVTDASILPPGDLKWNPLFLIAVGTFKRVTKSRMATFAT